MNVETRLEKLNVELKNEKENCFDLTKKYDDLKSLKSDLDKENQIIKKEIENVSLCIFYFLFRLISNKFK
jgi:hypothetical protein